MTTIQPAAWPEDAGEQIRARRPLRSVALFFAVVLLYSIITAIFFRAWIPFFHSGLIGPPEDNMRDFWNTWYTASASNWGRFFFTDLIRFPQGTVLATGSMLLAFLSLACGLVLDTVTLGRHEIKRMRYLEIPAPGSEGSSRVGQR